MNPLEAADEDIMETIIDNSNGFSKRILSLLSSREMVDVQLQVGKQLFDVHKLILCASSDVFKAMLTNCQWQESSHHTVHLKEDLLCEAAFGRFIHYIYSGELHLSHSTVCPLLTLADKYNVREMIPLCRNYMMENMNAPCTTSCVLQWWKIANLRSDTQLQNLILDYIECNFTKVLGTPDFLTADLETVNKILSSSRLAVWNEAMIFDGIILWLDCFICERKPSEKEIVEALRRLIRHIRWPMMTEYELKCLGLCPDVHNFFQTFRAYIRPPPCLASSFSLLTTDQDTPSCSKEVSRHTSSSSTQSSVTCDFCDNRHSNSPEFISSSSATQASCIKSPCDISRHNNTNFATSVSLCDKNLDSPHGVQSSNPHCYCCSCILQSVPGHTHRGKRFQKKPPGSPNDFFICNCCGRTKNSLLKKSKPGVCHLPATASRVYTSDYWCSTLTVSNFPAFPQYGTQTFFFSTPRTGYRYDDGNTLDWEVELSPKGVHFPPAILIGLERDGNRLVDEVFIRTVRLSVMSRSPQDLPLKVEVNVLVQANTVSQSSLIPSPVSGSQDAAGGTRITSYIKRCRRKTCIFDSTEQRHNLDDIVPFEDLSSYLSPELLTPDLYLTPTMTFTLYITIRPLPFG